MENQYIADLCNEDLNTWSCLTGGQKTIATAYEYSREKGFDCLVLNDSFRVKDAGCFHDELINAGITELFYASDSSNYMASLMAFQEAGAKMVGMVRLENPRYKREVETCGESWERPDFLAIKFIISD